MPVVFVIASDWTLRTTVCAELRELGIQALGMDTPADVGRAIASGAMPAAIVLEATSPVASDPAIRNLAERVPAVLIASRTESIDLPAAAAVFYRPVRIAEILYRIRELLQQAHPA